MRQLARRFPLGGGAQQFPLYTQTADQRREAAETFSPTGFADDYDGRLRIVHAGGQLAGAPAGQAIDATHSIWLQEQGMWLPLYTNDRGEDRHVICEAGTWTYLAETIRNAPSIAEFNQRSHALAGQNILSADKVWAQADRVVWFNQSDPNTHGVNLFQLGRLKDFTTNAEGHVVKLLKTETPANAATIVSQWTVEQRRTNAAATEYGHTDAIKSYNILPVTSALQLHIYPHWRRQSVDVYDPRQLERTPSYCGLAWDVQQMTRPHEFTPGAYYFWLNPLDFQMAGWLCRGIADVPDEIVQSRVFERLTPGQCNTVINQWKAAPNTDTPKDHTRVVQREWMGNYFHATDEQWKMQLLPASRCNSISYYMMASASNVAPLSLVHVDRTHPAPYGTWGYVLRQYRVIPPTPRRRFSVYDEAVALIRRIPLPEDAVIGQGPGTAPRSPLYWACHYRPAHIQLPRHRIIDGLYTVDQLLPDEARSYVVTTLRRTPTSFDEPEEPWAERDRSPVAIRPERAQEGDREQPPRLAAQRAAAAIQEVAVAEADQPPAPAPAPAERPPPRRPSRQPRPSPQRGAQAAAATPSAVGADYHAIFNTAARGANVADTLQTAILRLLNSLTEQPFPCPDQSWGTRRQLTNDLLTIPDLQPSNRRASMGNTPVIDNLCQLISATSRADTGLAQHLCAFLQRFLATGVRAGPPAGGPPPAPGGRGPPRDDSGAGGRGHSSPADQRDNGGGGRGGGRERRSPPPDDGAKRRRLGDGEQDAAESPRESRQRVRERAPSPSDRPTRSRRSQSPSPQRSDRSPSRRRGRSPTTRRSSRGRAYPRSTSPTRRLPPGEPRRQPATTQPFIFNRSPPAERRRSPISEGRHQAAMAALRNAAADQRVYKRGKGAEHTVVAYLGHNPQERQSRSIRPDTAAIGRTIYGHIKKSLDNGDYEPPATSPARSCSPPAPPARSPSPQLLDSDQPPSPPRVGLAERFSKLPDVLQHLKDGTSPPTEPGPPRPPAPTSLKEANDALLVSKLSRKTSTVNTCTGGASPTSC